MNIEVKDNSGNKNIKTSEFPFDKSFIGDELIEDEFKIFIRQETLKSIDDYLSGDLNNELGGVLVGDVCVNSQNEQFISIDNFIIAKHTNSSISRLTFTHDTWDQISNTLEKEFPGKIILGWFHSHPGHTVFLSGYDLFIQENFFNLEYMTAYVFDPVINERGFFYKRENKIIRTKGFYLYDIINNDGLKNLNSVNSQNESHTKEQDNSELNFIEDLTKLKKPAFLNLKNLIIISLALLNVLLFIFIIYTNKELKQSIDQKEGLVKELDEVRSNNIQLKEKLDGLLTEMELNSRQNLSLETGDSLPGNSESKNTDIKNDLKNSSGKFSGEKNSNSESIKYKVKAGDSLEKIAILFYKDKEKVDLLVKKNNLRNTSDISPGQILEIPE